MKRKFKYNLKVPIELLRPHEKTTNEHVSYWNKMYIEKSFIPAVAVSEENIIICIEDNGIGMDKNIQKLIFEKFYREQNGNIHDTKGHGLGLSYVKKIIDFHNGKISLESKKGVGTKFYLTLKNI